MESLLEIASQIADKHFIEKHLHSVAVGVDPVSRVHMRLLVW